LTGNEYWDSAYQSGDFEHWELAYPSPELAALAAAKMIRKDARILDVGCGGGRDAIFMAQCGFSVIGVDISVAALRIAERRAEEAYIEVDWRHGSVLDLPVEDKTIDLVTDRGLFHVIEDVDRPKYSSEVHRVLKPGGRAVIRGASRESAQDQFNPITEEAVERYFQKFERGSVLPIPLFSGMVAKGKKYSNSVAMDAKIVVLRKKAAK
jgi:ubiquinone/menaquinone biosynthesis C-methylase UbiE